jgi:hypothetical protein
MTSESPCFLEEKTKCAIGIKNNLRAAYPTKSGVNIAKKRNNDKLLFLFKAVICTDLSH